MSSHITKGVPNVLKKLGGLVLGKKGIVRILLMAMPVVCRIAKLPDDACSVLKQLAKAIPSFVDAAHKGLKAVAKFAAKHNRELRQLLQLLFNKALAMPTITLDCLTKKCPNAYYACLHMQPLHCAFCGSVFPIVLGVTLYSFHTVVTDRCPGTSPSPSAPSTRYP